MKTEATCVTSWQISLSGEEQHILLRPWIGRLGEEGQPAQQLVLTLETAHMLQRQLAESIRLLEERSPDAAERRKAQQPIAKDRRKTRHFEGSPISHGEHPHAPDQSGRANTEE